MKKIKPLRHYILGRSADILVGLEESIKLWTWLAQTGDSCKCNHPEFFGTINKYEDFCPLCECIKNRIRTSCFTCPLKEASGVHCGAVNSPYMEWLRSKSKEAKSRVAENIVSALQTAYYKETGAYYDQFEPDQQSI